MSKIICYCNHVTESEIEAAIAKGARTQEDIQTLTGACRGNRCKELNPSGRCCSVDIISMLDTNGSTRRRTGSCCR